ncbi:hypothetical protein [Pseudomonas sp. CGJS7]|uniref:hypothetical protein n=1 Tax=Pseudomonas sp. CGJS7 TaxID=3109348 RepID=UPI00300BCDE5
MLQRQLQQDRSGCGLACVAMLAGIGYAQARTLARALDIGPKPYRHRVGAGVRSAPDGYFTDARQLRRMLRVLGLAAGAERTVSDWRECDGDGIVAINHDPSNDRWHWDVHLRDAGSACVLDPNARVRSERRTDFGRMRPVRFIPVSGARR